LRSTYYNENLMNKSLLIADDFYEFPDKVREDALKSDFSVKGNYPGHRSQPFWNEDIKKQIESLIQNKIVWVDDIANGAFQYTTCYDRTWIHADYYNNWAGVLYLTPNAPASSGTGFYKHLETNSYYYPDDESLQKVCDSDSQDYTKWLKIDTAANIYNRLILFNAKRFHASLDYFGTSLENGRLFQTFFFNTAS
jgi:hypothetical protein